MTDLIERLGREAKFCEASGLVTVPKLLREAATALEAAREDAWQPIETAPKDGSLFLGWVSAERWSQVDGGGSGRGADVSEVDFCHWRTLSEIGFYENMMGQIGDSQDITHWMPLPAQPQGEE